MKTWHRRLCCLPSLSDASSRRVRKRRFDCSPCLNLGVKPSKLTIFYLPGMQYFNAGMKRTLFVPDVSVSFRCLPESNHRWQLNKRSVTSHRDTITIVRPPSHTHLDVELWVNPSLTRPEDGRNERSHLFSNSLGRSPCPCKLPQRPSVASASDTAHRSQGLATRSPVFASHIF
jgi:hypothetical protein